MRDVVFRKYLPVITLFRSFGLLRYIELIAHVLLLEWLE